MKKNGVGNKKKGVPALQLYNSDLAMGKWFALPVQSFPSELTVVGRILLLVALNNHRAAITGNICEGFIELRSLPPVVSLRCRVGRLVVKFTVAWTTEMRKVECNGTSAGQVGGSLAAKWCEQDQSEGRDGPAFKIPLLKEEVYAIGNHELSLSKIQLEALTQWLH